jgi:hypothetical protein
MLTRYGRTEPLPIAQVYDPRCIGLLVSFYSAVTDCRWDVDINWQHKMMDVTEARSAFSTKR